MVFRFLKSRLWEPEEPEQRAEPEVSGAETPAEDTYNAVSLAREGAGYARKVTETCIPQSLLAEITAIINSGLPDIVKNNINIEKEQEDLYVRLQPFFVVYVEKLVGQIESDSLIAPRAHIERLQHEKQELEGRIAELERERSDMQEGQLSAERQKRTVAERIRELESRIAAQEAEREEGDRSRQALKVQLSRERTQRVALEAQIGCVAEEKAILEHKLNALEKRQGAAATGGDASEMQALKGRIAELEAQLQATSALQEAHAVREEQIDHFTEAHAQLQEALQQADERMRGLQAELDDLRSRQSADPASDPETESELKRVRHELQVTADLYDAMKRQREELGRTVERLESDIRDRDTDVKRLEKALARAKSEKKGAKGVVANPSISDPLFITDDSLPESEEILDWLIPTRPDTPEEIAARKAAERKEREEKEAQEKKREEPDPAQMSLW